MFKKTILVALSLLLVLAMSPLAILAQSDDSNQFSDIPDDWSAQALENAVKNGLLFGSNGKILPGHHVTRAELAAIVNRAFGARAKAPLDRFTDVAKTAWYYDDMAKAVKMKTFRGSANQLHPNDPVTREEAFAVIARAMKLPASEKAPSGFSDLDDISSWSRGEVFSLIDAGYVKGADGRIQPKNPITRAEFAQLMDNIIKVYIRQAGVYNEVAAGNVMINVPGVTLKDLTIQGDLIIGDGVGDGDVVLENVEVSGRLVVRGGGENSIVIRGASRIDTVIVAKVDGAVRVFAEDGTELETVHIDDGDDRVILEGSIGTVIVNASLPVELNDAAVRSVMVEASQAAVTIGTGSAVDNVVIAGTASATTLQVKGTVSAIAVEAPGTTIEGTGTVQNVVVKQGANGTKIETENTRIVVEEGVQGTTGVAGVQLEPGEHDNSSSADTSQPPAGGGGGGGGGGGSNDDDDDTPAPILLSKIHVAGVAVIEETLTAKVEPGNATVQFQWLRSDHENDGYVPIADATEKTYKLVAADAGKYIKVKATGTGNYTGTVESHPVGPVTAVLPEQSTYKLTYTGLAESYTAGKLITGSSREEINAAVEAAIKDLAPVRVTLASAVLGKTGYEAVRILPVGAGPNLQLWAKDTANNWYDINVTGWGAADGFELAADYNATTEIFVLSDKAGAYELKIRLVDLKDHNKVIAETGGTVKVADAEQTSLTLSAADVDATAGEAFTMAVTAKGTVAKADKDHSVRFYGVIAGLDASDIEFTTIPGGKPAMVTDADERKNAGAGADDLVLAWGPADGFPLSAHDYSEGVTTEFKATIKKAGTYTVTFVFYDLTGEKRLNGEHDTATIKVAEAETSLAFSATSVTAATYGEFTMAVTAKGTVADADKGHLVRFYGVITGLDANDIELAAIPGGKPAMVTDADERKNAGAGADDLVLAWGPASGFPLGAHDYSEGVTTEFKATIKKVGTYTVTFVFYDLTEDKRLNGEHDSATIEVMD